MAVAERQADKAHAVIFYDLAGRDGRKVIEIRAAVRLGCGKMFAGPRAVFYSVAYATQVERQVAFARARAACDAGGLDATYQDGSGRRALWQ